MDVLQNALTASGRLTGRALRWVVQWWWGNTSKAWIEAWGEPELGLRIVCLVIGPVFFWFVGQHAFEVSVLTGLSFISASFLAVSRATVFRVAIFRVGPSLIRRVPLGVASPFLIFCGLMFSEALRPVIFAAKDEALAGDLMSSAIVIGVVVILQSLATRLKQGQLPEGWDREHKEISTRLS